MITQRAAALHSPTYRPPHLMVAAHWMVSKVYLNYRGKSINSEWNTTGDMTLVSLHSLLYKLILRLASHPLRFLSGWQGPSPGLHGNRAH